MNNNRVVVVTGAAAGIGLGIAERFAQDGHPTVMIDVQEDLLEQESKRLQAAGANVLACRADVANRAEIETAYSAARSRFGPISIVIPNAGIANFIPFLSMKIEDWQRVIDINLTGVFHTVQAAVPDMIEAKWGRIVTISSQAGQSGGPQQAHYSASKGGVIGMTKALARELAPHGITVNTVPPSLVDTPQARRSEAVGEFPLEMIVQMIPISRPGQPSEIASACAFLASDEASYVTGQVLGVNGGMYM
ncbi:SDR family NAD(P)-dependent oxidoreductase [Sphingomonas sp. LaA6.9]|uniref:SDR family oxidoreductase n=1 Tax=Sphingomonas sp. LaA6.9 TaxID=2919914 RepID=UPI001F4FEA6B|nr:SDR family NAD(P)-dependent oxidoreductase [Sphingomonas sp. LaA6.9]MCJ8156602.1 SDR family oxidoreductase [Sphingomonas sp. LaA6.9]